MTSQKLILLLFAIIWPLGQIFELPTPFPQTHLYAIDILAALLSLSLLFSSSARKTIKSDPLFRPISVFFTVATLSLALASFNLDTASILIAAAYLVRWTAYTSIYFAIKVVKPTAKQYLIPIYSLLAFTILGLFQYFLLPDTRFLVYYGFDDHFYRLISSFLDPNFAGLALIIAIFLILSQKKLPKTLTILPAIALALTFSRASYLTLIIAVAYLLFRRPQKIVIALIGLVIVGLILAPKPSGEGVNLLRTFSITSRIQDSKEGLELFTQKPILGYGFNTLRSFRSNDLFAADRSGGGFSSSYVFVLITTGIVGFAAYLNLLYHLFRKTYPDPYLSASYIAILVHSFFNHSLFYIWIMSLLWVIVASKNLFQNSGSSRKADILQRKRRITTKD